MTQPTTHPTVTGLLTSIVRTLVPAIVGVVLGAAAKRGFELDSGAITEFVTLVITVVYYAIVRVLETKIGPAWGWLLGVAKVPGYPQVVNTTAVEIPAGGAPPHGD